MLGRPIIQDRISAGSLGPSITKTFRIGEVYFQNEVLAIINWPGRVFLVSASIKPKTDALISCIACFFYRTSAIRLSKIIGWIVYSIIRRLASTVV